MESRKSANSTMDPVIGALVGVAFQELYNTIKRYMQPSLTPVASLRSKLGVLADKVQDLSRKFTAIDESYPEAGAHPETQKLRELLEKANVLVIDCSGLRWWSLRRKRRFSKRLAELSDSFDRMLAFEFGPGRIMARLMTLHAEVVWMNAKLDRMYQGQEVSAPPPSGRRSGGSVACGGRGMRAEIRYERTEKKTSLSVSVCWGCCCGGDGNGDGGYEWDGRRRGGRSKWA